jgi:hypothetical protein
LDSQERLGDFDSFLVGIQKGGAIRALTQVIFEGCENRWVQPPPQIIGDQPHLIFARVVWSIGSLGFWFIVQLTFFSLIRAGALFSLIESFATPTLSVFSPRFFPFWFDSVLCYRPIEPEPTNARAGRCRNQRCS